MDGVLNQRRKGFLYELSIYGQNRILFPGGCGGHLEKQQSSLRTGQAISSKSRDIDTETRPVGSVVNTAGGQGLGLTEVKI